MANLRKIILVTGATTRFNTSIGYELVKWLLQSKQPYHLLLGGRSLEKAKLAVDKLREECPDATNTVEPLEVDLSNDQSIEKAYEQVSASPGRLDILVNNAGATFDLEFLANKVSLRECFNQAYNVNVAGTTVMTWTFMPLLLKSSDPRLIFVAGLSAINQAAREYFPTPPQPAGWPKKIDFETIGYRCSKVALNMLMLDWNHKLKADGVKVWAVGPGMNATNLGGDPDTLKNMNLPHPSTGANVIRGVVEGERDTDVGKLIGKNGVMEY